MVQKDETGQGLQAFIDLTHQSYSHLIHILFKTLSTIVLKIIHRFSHFMVYLQALEGCQEFLRINYETKRAGRSHTSLGEICKL